MSLLTFRQKQALSDWQDQSEAGEQLLGRVLCPNTFYVIFWVFLFPLV